MVPAAALLPLRFFFGITFLYAGLDKLIDPAFFDPASPGSIQAQMLAFERGSPLGALVALARPDAGAVGLSIAVAEVAIGIGALTGLAFRVAAAGGAMLSLLFFLTVSWATRPFYLGSDLPYTVGWLTLALAGHGGLLVPTWVERRGAAHPRGTPRSGRPARGETAPSPERRAVLQTGLLAVAAVAVSSLAVPVRMLGLDRLAPPPSPSPVPAAGQTPGSGIGVAAAADVDAHGAVAFTVPFDAPAPLPAGDPAVIVRLADGSYAAFDAVCTHAGCTVEWEAADAALACPCHGAVFDPQQGGAAVVGPARQPLASIPIVVDPASGRILLKT